MKIINLFAGPGAGKTTIATSLFSEMKWRNIDVEYVSEIAKDYTWERNFMRLSNQPLIAAEQEYKIFKLADKNLDYVITDSPIILGIFYTNNPTYQEVVKLLWSQYSSRNINYFIKRNKPYKTAGRNQTEEESKEIDCKILRYLQDSGCSFKSILGDKEAVSVILDDLMI